MPGRVLLQLPGELLQRLDPAADRPVVPLLPELPRVAGVPVVPQVLQVVLEHGHRRQLPVGRQQLEERPDVLPAASAPDPQHLLAVRLDDHRGIAVALRIANSSIAIFSTPLRSGGPIVSAR